MIKDAQSTRYLRLDFYKPTDPCFYIQNACDPERKQPPQPDVVWCISPGTKLLLCRRFHEDRGPANRVLHS